MKKLLLPFAILLSASSFVLANPAMTTTSDPKASMEVLFQKRLTVRQKANSANKDLIKFHLEQLRDKEELLGEQLNHFRNKPLEAKAQDAFSTDYLLNPKYNELDFKSGDIVVVRGMSALSALVSNLTDTPSSYSHTLIIYVNPADGKKWGIEALIDAGIVAQPLEAILTEGVPRAMLYRHQDSVLAHAAAQLAFEYANAPKEKQIGYDTKLVLDDYSAVYCSEFVRMVYDQASNNKLVLPSFPSTIGGKFAGLQKALDMQKTKILVYSPLDIDLEPGFDLVAEWRDFGTTVNYRIKDQIVKYVLAWLENQKTTVAKANAVYKKSKSADSGSEEESTSSGTSLGKVLSGLNTILNAETNVFINHNNEFLAANNRNMTTSEIKAAITQSSLKRHAEIVFMQNGYLAKKR